MRRKRGQPAALKSAPPVAIDYNKFMGGCDRANSLRSTYNTYLTHKRRWYMSLVYYGLDVLIVNALIYANYGKPKKDHVTSKDFRKHVAELFAARALAITPRKHTPEQGRRVRRRLDEFPPTLTQGNHLIQKAENVSACAWCYKTTQKRNRAAYCCKLCMVHLHADCFFPFHSHDVPAAQI